MIIGVIIRQLQKSKRISHEIPQIDLYLPSTVVSIFNAFADFKRRSLEAI